MATNLEIRDRFQDATNQDKFTVAVLNSDSQIQTQVGNFVDANIASLAAGLGFGAGG